MRRAVEVELRLTTGSSGSVGSGCYGRLTTVLRLLVL